MSSSTRRGVAAAVGAILLLAGAYAVPAQAGLSECPGSPQVFPTSELRPGMQGQGLTVAQGRDPEPFDVEILGVLPDGIAPGRDMIIVDVSSPDIEAAGGIWFGMSGSPVYINNRLVGAVAFGLSFGPSTIGGLTAAEDMAEILDYPQETETSEQRRVAMPSYMKQRIARQTGTAESEVGNSLVRLKVPVSISGLTGDRLDEVATTFKQERLPLVPYAGASSAASNAVSTTRLRPGDSFAAAISYGDLTLAGIGTTTIVCNDQGIAFGHPFFFGGSTRLGANAADAITIVDDPFFGAYKLATVEELVGTVDQDRLAGIRANFASVPALIPISSDVTAVELNRSRAGGTQVVDEEFLPFLSFAHMLSNIDSVFDHIGEGNSTLSWTVSGTREDGSTWQLPRTNLYASEFDIAIESVFEIADQVFTLSSNPFEDVEFTDIDVTASVSDEIKRYRLQKVLVRKNGQFVESRRVRSRPGGVIRLRAVLAPFQEAEDERLVDLTLRVPDNARRDGFITIAGGRDQPCFFFLDGGRCVDELGNKVESFDELLAALSGAAQNNDLSAKLRMGGRKVKSLDTERLDQVVFGHKEIFVSIGGGGGRGGEPVFVEGKG